MDLTTRSPPGPQWTGKCHSLCGERGQTAQSTKTWDLNEIKQRCNLFLQENLTEYHWWIWLIQFCTYTLLHVYVYMYKYISTNQCMNFWSQYDILCGKVEEIRCKSLELSPRKLKPTGCSWSKSTLPQTKRLMQWCPICFHHHRNIKGHIFPFHAAQRHSAAQSGTSRRWTSTVAASNSASLRASSR